jgi:hypothetical protein
MTQEELFDQVLSLQCSAATLAAKWSNKVKLGKWCPEQECALILTDWALEVLCNHIVCGEVPVSKDNQINGILQGPDSPKDYFLLFPIDNNTEIRLTVNGLPALVMQVESPFLGFNYNMALLLTTYFDNVVIYNDNGTYETPEDVPVGEVIYYNITTPCDKPIESVFVDFVSYSLSPLIEPGEPGKPSFEEPLYNRVYLTEPTPYSREMELYGPIITPGECADPNSPCFTNCFTDEEICKLIGKVNKVLTFKCDCC